MKTWEELYFSLQEDWQEKMNECFEEGGYVTEAVLHIGLTGVEHERLFKNCEEYREFIFNGMRISEAHWMKWARENVTNKDVNVQMFKQMMQRFYAWDKIVDKYNTIDDSIEDRTKRGYDAEKFEQKYLRKDN